MANWDKLNAEFDSALDSMTPGDWIQWKNNFKNKNNMTQFKSPQLTACFRQWKAEGTHCRFTHAYKVWFDIDFDQDINDVFNLYPELKLYLNEWFLFNFNYKTFVSESDPELDTFKYLDQNKIISLITMPEVGCERFSEYVLDGVNTILEQFGLDVKCVRVETWEHEKNSGVAYI